MPLQPTSLFVQPPDRRQFLNVTEPRLPHRGLQHVDGTIIDLERHRKGMPVLPAMGDGKSRRVAEAIGRAVHDLGDLGQRADRSCTDARHQQKFGKIRGTALGRGGEIAMQAAGHDVLRPDIVMRGHDEMRQQGLGSRIPMLDTAALQVRELPFDPVRTDGTENVELPPPRSFRAPIGQIDDHTLFDPVDRGVRLVDETPQTFRQPVIAPGLAAIAVHALLDHDPVSVIGDDEAMKIKLKSILNRRTVHLGNKPTRLGECRAVETDPITDSDKLMRRLARVIAASPADMDAEILGTRISGRASARR